MPEQVIKQTAFKGLYKRYIQAIIGVVATIAVLVLIGWQFHIDLFKKPIPGFVAMNPVTAILFLLSGIALWLLNSDKRTLYVKTLAAVIVLVGALKIVSVISGLDIPVDRLLFNERITGDLVNNLPNRMAPNTAFNFLLLGAALFAAGSNNYQRAGMVNYITLPVLVVSIFSFIGYLYGVKQFYGILTYIPMAPHTAFCFILSASALLLLHRRGGFMSTITSPFTGGSIARVLIPCVIGVPVLLGYIRLHYTAGISSELATSLLITTIIIIFLLVVWYIARKLNIADAERADGKRKMVQYNRELSLINKELESFSYSVSHDLRTPLRAVNGYSRILQEEYGDKLDDEGIRILNSIMNNATKMGQLIDNLLAFSRLGRAELTKMHISMKEMAINVASDLRQVDNGRQIDLIVKDLPGAHADSVTIKQVWINLLGNAIKYSKQKPKSEIEVGAETTDEEFIYYIKDNGAGFDMRYKDKLFGVFQRLHAAEEFEGTGVGLAIVQRIITRHGGRVWAEGKVDEGATFYFAIPRNENIAITDDSVL